jgi:hypothetical protein
MKAGLVHSFTATTKDNRDNRDACIFSAERILPCGAIVSERNGRIIAKTSVVAPKP